MNIMYLKNNEECVMMIYSKKQNGGNDHGNDNDAKNLGCSGRS